MSMGLYMQYNTIIIHILIHTKFIEIYSFVEYSVHSMITQKMNLLLNSQNI